MPNTNQHIDQLIARFLAGEATEQEKQELNRWMDQSEANRKYFGDIQFVHDTAAASHRIINVDVDRAWAKVKNQMKGAISREEPEPRTIAFRTPTWLKAAAAVLLASGFALALYLFQQKAVDAPFEMIAVASTDTIKPLTLGDSSTVTLNRNATIRYAANYGVEERRLTLTGEAFFEVTPIENLPFIVEANETLIKVLGTSFNVRANESDSLVEVYVRAGEVIFFTSNQEGVTLKGGETGIYNRNTQKFRKIHLSDPNAIAYTNRVFVFYNTSLNEVAQRLSSIYGVKISIPNPNISNQTITVTFEDDDIETIMMIITETLGLDYKHIDNMYIIHKQENTENTDDADEHK